MGDEGEELDPDTGLPIPKKTAGGDDEEDGDGDNGTDTM